jgi:putative polyhydroxyalkanoate system protein
MPKINLSQRHSMDPVVLREKVRAVEGKIREKYGAATEWIDERTVTVAGPGVRGTMVVRDESVDIDLDLGFMLSPFRGKIEEGLARELQKMVGAGA